MGDEKAVKPGVKVTSEAVFIGDFKFNYQGNLIKKYKEWKDACNGDVSGYEQKVKELMAMHYAFYGQFQKESKYVKSGSVLWCSGGSKLTAFDILKDHGVKHKDGSPIGICSDCKANENIYSFEGCAMPAPVGYPDRPVITVKSKPKTAMQKCIPVLNSSWSKTKSSKIKIWNESTGKYEEAISTGDFLTCFYGGIISVVEVPDNVGVKRVEILDSKGLNMIANMERNPNQIIYDNKTGIISSIPNKLPDIGYGHDINKRPINPLPKSLSASEAYELLKKDVAEFENAVATGVNANLTQDQFNALVGLRYNVGSLGEIDGLLLYLENGSYEKSKLKKLINDHYDAIIKKKPDKEKYRNGWYRRTETTISIFFDGNYGDMPIDAVRGKVAVQ